MISKRAKNVVKGIVIALIVVVALIFASYQSYAMNWENKKGTIRFMSSGLVDLTVADPRSGSIPVVTVNSISVAEESAKLIWDRPVGFSEYVSNMFRGIFGTEEGRGISSSATIATLSIINSASGEVYYNKTTTTKIGWFVDSGDVTIGPDAVPNYVLSLNVYSYLKPTYLLYSVTYSFKYGDSMPTLISTNIPHELTEMQFEEE